MDGGPACTAGLSFVMAFPTVGVDVAASCGFLLFLALDDGYHPVDSSGAQLGPCRSHPLDVCVEFGVHGTYSGAVRAAWRIPTRRSTCSGRRSGASARTTSR